MFPVVGLDYNIRIMAGCGHFRNMMSSLKFGVSAVFSPKGAQSANNNVSWTCDHMMMLARNT